MAWQVYILQSRRTCRTYVGYTSDVPARLERHNQGRVQATRVGRPWEILFQEACADESAARKREAYWKSGAGRRRVARSFFAGQSVPLAARTPARPA